MQSNFRLIADNWVLTLNQTQKMVIGLPQDTAITNVYL
jgi:hypothetical protein